MADQFHYDVFLSHSSKDKVIVRPLAERLREDGLRVWFDESEIKPGGHWLSKIEAGLEQSRILVVCVSANGSVSDWVKLEVGAFLARDALNTAERIILLRFDEFEIKGLLAQFQYINWLDREQEYDKLFEACRPSASPLMPSTANQRGVIPNSIPDHLLRDYLNRLESEELTDHDKYIKLGGAAPKPARRAVMRTLFQLVEVLPGKAQREAQATEPFENAVEKILDLRRAVLLGEPGAGKTTTLGKLAADLVGTARADLADPARQPANAPVPLFVKLKKWEKAEQPLFDFIAQELGELGLYLDQLLNERAALLLDGLNELPANQHEAKHEAVKQFIEKRPHLLAVVSCRELDYKLDLGLACIRIKELDPPRIRDFVKSYLGPEKGETLFWKLFGENEAAAGDTYKSFLSEFNGKLDKLEEVFWIKPQLPGNLHWGYDREDKRADDTYWHNWLRLREAPDSLLVLARNPYMLSMLASIYDEAEDGSLPKNRGDLFDRFVQTLQAREKVPPNEQEQLTEGLARVAYKMQTRKVQEGYADNSVAAQTVLPAAEVKASLGERFFYLAGSASLLNLGEQVSFTHQLLQEYFAAKYIAKEFKANLAATEHWPRASWWQRTGWEETAILLAGLCSDDCSEVVEWVAEANPEVAAQCIVRSGAHTPDATRIRLRDKWLKRLDKPALEPAAQARAALGRALGQIRVGNHPSDNRPGVGVTSEGLPDIAWIKIPGGEFQYGTEKQAGDPDWLNPAKPRPLKLPTFWISRYPITYAQFRCFAEDKGYGDELWWKGLAADEDDRQPGEQSFKFDNHPCDTVNWYEAIAFCRWLSCRKGGGYDLRKIDEWKVRLPTEFEWEKAARGPDGRIYPYEGEFDAAKGNVDETGIGQTSAVGIFPNGKSFYGVEEMSGNVWEWCLSDYDKPQKDVRKEKLETDNTRVLRGGSWFVLPSNARSVRRDFLSPGDRDFGPGFRVAVSRPPS